MSAEVIKLSQDHDLDQVHNPEAEQSLLGALLLNNSVLDRVSDYLRPIHFASAIHGKIYEAIMKLVERGQVADPITLKDLFDKDEILKDVGGAGYLVDLTEAVVSIVNVADYGRLIYDLYLRRQLITIGEDVVLAARKPTLDAMALQQIENAERKLYNLATEGGSGGGFVTFRHALGQAIAIAETAFKRDTQVVGVSTGLIDMDKVLGGLHRSDLLILAGRPSMGKTALALNIAFNAAQKFHKTGKEGAPVAVFSLEMSSEQLASRLLSSETGVSSDRIRRGEIAAKDFPKFVEASRELSDIPLYIDDTPALSITAIRNRARRLQRQHGLGMIVIDYLQLLQGTGSKGNTENRVQEVSEITRGLKALAKELNVPVLAASQLSRAVEQRDDKRPQLSDLRESGSIEQDADVVMFIYREEYYESRKRPPEGTEKHKEWQMRMEQVHNKAEVIIAKQRHGPIGTVNLFFDGSLTKFGNYVQGRQ